MDSMKVMVANTSAGRPGSTCQVSKATGSGTCWAHVQTGNVETTGLPLEFSRVLHELFAGETDGAPACPDAAKCLRSEDNDAEMAEASLTEDDEVSDEDESDAYDAISVIASSLESALVSTAVPTHVSAASPEAAPVTADAGKPVAAMTVAFPDLASNGVAAAESSVGMRDVGEEELVIGSKGVLSDVLDGPDVPDAPDGGDVSWPVQGRMSSQTSSQPWIDFGLETGELLVDGEANCHESVGIAMSDPAGDVVVGGSERVADMGEGVYEGVDLVDVDDHETPANEARLQQDTAVPGAEPRVNGSIREEAIASEDAESSYVKRDPSKGVSDSGFASTEGVKAGQGQWNTVPVVGDAPLFDDVESAVFISKAMPLGNNLAGRRGTAVRIETEERIGEPVKIEQMKTSSRNVIQSAQEHQVGSNASLNRFRSPLPLLRGRAVVSQNTVRSSSDPKAETVLRSPVAFGAEKAARAWNVGVWPGQLEAEIAVAEQRGLDEQLTPALVATWADQMARDHSSYSLSPMADLFLAEAEAEVEGSRAAIPGMVEPLVVSATELPEKDCVPVNVTLDDEAPPLTTLEDESIREMPLKGRAADDFGRSDAHISAVREEVRMDGTDPVYQRLVEMDEAALAELRGSTDIVEPRSGAGSGEGASEIDVNSHAGAGERVSENPRVSARGADSKVRTQGPVSQENEAVATQRRTDTQPHSGSNGKTHDPHEGAFEANMESAKPPVRRNTGADGELAGRDGSRVSTADLQMGGVSAEGLHLADGARVSEEVGRSVLQQIAADIGARGGRETGEFRATLTPESLGEVRIRIRVQGGVCTATIRVGNREVGNYIERHGTDLKVLLAEQGIDLADLSVSVGSHSASGDANAWAQASYGTAAFADGEKRGRRGYAPPTESWLGESGLREGRSVQEPRHAEASMWSGYGRIDYLA